VADLTADLPPKSEPQRDKAHVAELGEAPHVAELGETEKSNYSNALSEGQAGGTALVNQGTTERAADSKALAEAGVIGDVQLTGLGDHSLTGFWSNDSKLIEDYDALSKKVDAPEMTTAEAIALRTLPGDQKDMYRLMLASLGKLANKEINPAEYMAEGLRNAAKLAQANESSWWNPFGSSKEDLFVNYVGMAFSDKSLGLGNIMRVGAGSPFDLAGATLERTATKINGADGQKGFNTNVADSQNPSNSVTHHFRELMMVGYNRGRTIGNLATTTVDNPEVNPGDVRNGFFGTMIGSALKNGKITPTEAAEMTIWAFTAHGGTQPPWGEHNENGRNLSTDDYFLNPWLKAFRERKP